MFGKKEETQPVNAGATAPAVKTDDMVLHVMPKEFLGKPAQGLSAPVQAPAPQAPRPMPAPAPLPVAVVPPAPVALPPAQMVKPPAATVKPPAPKSKFRLFIILFFFLILFAGAGVGAYYYFFLMPVPAPVVVPTPTPEPTPEPTPTPTPTPTAPTPGKDTDSDGLTDVEELLYGTDYRNPDTDGDTFLDGNEVYHRYHPNGKAPQTLLDTGAVRIFQSPGLPFTIYYPSPWTPVVDATAGSVSFRAPSTESVTVSSTPKDPTENLEVWYQHNVPNENEQALAPTYTSEGLLALSKPDGRTAYVDGGDKVFTLTYDLGDSTTIEFLTTFQMMLNSLTLLP